MAKHPGARHGSPKETGRNSVRGGHVGDRVNSYGPGDVGRFVKGAAPRDDIGMTDGARGGKGGRMQNPKWGDDD